MKISCRILQTNAGSLSDIIIIQSAVLVHTQDATAKFRWTKCPTERDRILQLPYNPILSFNRDLSRGYNKFTDGSLKDKECVGLPNNEAILKKSVNTIRVPAAAARRIPRINRKFLFIEYGSSQILFGFHQVIYRGFQKCFQLFAFFDFNLHVL